MTMDIRDKSLSKRIPEHIFERVHQDVGQASMCWSDAFKRDSIFDSSQAAEIANNLCHFIADEMDKVRVEWGKELLNNPNAMKDFNPNTPQP